MGLMKKIITALLILVVQQIVIIALYLYLPDGLDYIFINLLIIVFSWALIIAVPLSIAKFRYSIHIKTSHIFLFITLSFFLSYKLPVSVLPFFEYVDHRLSEFHKAQHLTRENQYEEFVPKYSSYPEKRSLPEIERKALSEIKGKLPSGMFIRHLQMDNYEDILWYEVIDRSIPLGSTSMFGYYDLTTNSFSKLVSLDEIWASLEEKPSGNIQYMLKEKIVDSFVLEEIYTDSKLNSKLVLLFRASP